MKLTPHSVLYVLLVLAALQAQAADTRVKATLEPERIGIDETATLTIEVRGGGLERIRFRPDFDLHNLEVVGGPYQFEDIRLGDGRLTRSFRVSWRLRALDTGEARVRDLRIRISGHTYSLGEREIRVQEEPVGVPSAAWEPGDPQAQDDPLDRIFDRWTPPWRQEQRRPPVFLRAEVRPMKPVVGQQVLYTVYLYTLADVAAVTPRSVPEFQGFWVRDIPQPQNLPTDMVEMDGKRYGRVVLLQKALFPIRAGRLDLEPTEMDLLVRQVDRRFFGPPVATSEQVSLRTAAMPVDVQPLPPAPAGFTGAVGSMALTARVEPQQVRMGEAATVTLTLAGEGNLQGVPEPEIPAVPGLTVLPAQQDGEEKVAGTTVQGTRTWSYPVVPERAGSYSLPPARIPYFDPEEGEYRVAAATPLQLTILPAPAPPKVQKERPARSARETQAPGETDPARPAPALIQRWRTLLPWALGLTGALALTWVLVQRRRSSDSTPAGKAPARHRMESALKEAEGETRPRQMAARIEEAWRELLSERWDIPPGTPSPRWGDLLTDRGADPEAARELVRLADDLHYLRYAPQLSACESLFGEVLGRCRRLARRLG